MDKKLDKSKIVKPQLEFSSRALDQMYYMCVDDPYFSQHFFRLSISGKGCDGFDYSFYLDNEVLEDDYIYHINHHSHLYGSKVLEIRVDLFTAFYLPFAHLDYLFDAQENNEGFIISWDRGKFKGKFWRSNKDLEPPLISS